MRTELQVRLRDGESGPTCAATAAAPLAQQAWCASVSDKAHMQLSRNTGRAEGSRPACSSTLPKGQGFRARPAGLVCMVAGQDLAADSRAVHAPEGVA